MVKKESNTKLVIAGGYTSKWSGYGTFNDGRRIYFRSLWEYNYAKYLDYKLALGSIQAWEYEPKRFYFREYKRGPYDYLPDFKVTNTEGIVEWHEVKGWMNSKSRSKIKRFEKNYPEEGKIHVIDKHWFKDMEITCMLIPGWIKHVPKKTDDS